MSGEAGKERGRGGEWGGREGAREGWRGYLPEHDPEPLALLPWPQQAEEREEQQGQRVQARGHPVGEAAHQHLANQDHIRSQAEGGREGGRGSWGEGREGPWQSSWCHLVVEQHVGQVEDGLVHRLVEDVPA